MGKIKSILTLSAQQAFEFFMQAEQYCTFELPEYYEFQPILDFVRNNIGDKTFEDCLAADPYLMTDVNLDILLNKDGRYAIRPLALVNPYLYYFLIRDICDEHHWELIRDCFNKFKAPNVTACAIPVIRNEKEAFHNATTILNWWNATEQRSLELSLEYRYMFVTDITNCYGSINPQTIDSALSMQGTRYATSERHEWAHRIVTYLRALQNGRNIGIPQGSEIFNLLAEIILGYSDLILIEEIAQEVPHCNYEVLRYRDDYRIFCDDKDKLEEISYILQRILRRLNFQLNSKKTMVSDSIITDSIKSDKQFYVFNTPIYKKRRVYKPVEDKDGKISMVPSIEYDCDFNGLQKNLLYILLFGRKYPNSGQIRTQLNEFDDRISKILEESEETRRSLFYDEVELDDAQRLEDNPATDNAGKKPAEDKPKIFPKFRKYYYRPIRESIRPMVAIATQIAMENITAAHYALRIVSRLVDTLDDEGPEKKDIIRKVCTKLRNQHNTTYLEIWLQNMTYNTDKLHDDSNYSQPLCKLIMGNDIALWNNAWLRQPLYDGFPYRRICNEEKLKEVTPVIQIRSRFEYDY